MRCTCARTAAMPSCAATCASTRACAQKVASKRDFIKSNFAPPKIFQDIGGCWSHVFGVAVQHTRSDVLAHKYVRHFGTHDVEESSQQFRCGRHVFHVFRVLRIGGVVRTSARWPAARKTSIPWT